MKNFILIIVIFLTISGLAITNSSKNLFSNDSRDKITQLQPTTTNNKSINAAKFDNENYLIRPENYREWIFVGSSLGLNYQQNLVDPSQITEQFYHNTYIYPDAYREFSRTGKFPEGTMLVLEILTQEKKKEPGLQGSYEKDVIAIEASVKNSKRFKDGWAYFSFDKEGGGFLTKAKAFESKSCFDCHDKKAETDHVFTQFYPVLRSAKASIK